MKRVKHIPTGKTYEVYDETTTHVLVMKRIFGSTQYDYNTYDVVKLDKKDVEVLS